MLFFSGGFEMIVMLTSSWQVGAPRHWVLAMDTCWLQLKTLLLLLLFWPHLPLLEVPGSGIEPEPQQRPELLQGQCWILSLLCHTRTCSFLWFWFFLSFLPPSLLSSLSFCLFLSSFLPSFLPSSLFLSFHIFMNKYQGSTTSPNLWHENRPGPRLAW